MIVVDIETTGLNPRLHSIVSLGAVDFEDPSNRFYEECRIDSGCKYTDKALQINGFSIEEITDRKKQTVAQLLSRYFEWAEKIPDKTVAGQNVDFDKDFINATCGKHLLTQRINKRVVDMHGLCYSRFLLLNRKILLTDGSSALDTDTILEFVGLQERSGAHNALEDALLEAEAFSRLIYGRSLISEYKQFATPTYLLSRNSTA